MTELRRLYNLFAPTSVADLTNQMNRVLSLLSERLDQIEGYRGTPTFKADINLDGNTVSNSGQAVVASELPRLDQTLNSVQTWPIGSVFIAVVSTNPNTLLGYGTWTHIAVGQMLVGYKSGDADFGTLEGTGGDKTIDLEHQHSLSAHTHELSNHIHSINHTHSASSQIGAGAATVADAAFTGNSGTPSNNDSGAPSIDETDDQLSATQSILNPYFTVYVWKRTA